MTGGPRGTHRGRVADPTGGAHWWRGDGPTGGGSHAAGAPRRRRAVLALLMAAVVVVLAAGILAVVAGREAGSAGPSGPSLATAPPTPPIPGGGGGGGAADAVLQARLDVVLTGTPVRFAPEVAQPLPGSGLGPLADALRAAPDLPVTVEGYTAPIGADGPRAQELSQQRADGVARALAAAGVDPARLRAVGRGDTSPRATLDASRRVELRVG